MYRFWKCTFPCPIQVTLLLSADRIRISDFGFLEVLEDRGFAERRTYIVSKRISFPGVSSSLETFLGKQFKPLNIFRSKSILRQIDQQFCNFMLKTCGSDCKVFKDLEAWEYVGLSGTDEFKGTRIFEISRCNFRRYLKNLNASGSMNDVTKFEQRYILCQDLVGRLYYRNSATRQLVTNVREHKNLDFLWQI